MVLCEVLSHICPPRSSFSGYSEALSHWEVLVPSLMRAENQSYCLSSGPGLTQISQMQNQGRIRSYLQIKIGGSRKERSVSVQEYQPENLFSKNKA